MTAALLFDCLACGTALEFRPGALSVHCSICEDDRPLPLRFGTSMPSVPVAPEAADSGPLDGHTHYRCDRCRTLLSAATPPSSCSLCGGGVTPAQDSPRLLVPHGALPPLVDGVTAKGLIDSELARHKQAPLPRRPELVFVPWLVFETTVHARYDGEKGQYEKRGDNTVLVWVKWSGQIERFFENRRTCLSIGLTADLSGRLEPWDWAFTAPIDDAPLAEGVWERSALPVEQIVTRAMPQFDTDLEAEIRYDIGGDRQRVHHVDAYREDDRMRVVMLPVWVGHLAEGTQVAINGRTGEALVAGLQGAQAEPDDMVDDLGASRRTNMIVALAVGFAIFVGILIAMGT